MLSLSPRNGVCGGGTLRPTRFNEFQFCQRPPDTSRRPVGPMVGRISLLSSRMAPCIYDSSVSPRGTLTAARPCLFSGLAHDPTGTEWLQDEGSREASRRMANEDGDLGLAIL